jgi:hypothetical protein
MRPCVECGYHSDPNSSPKCPECGTTQLPVDWTVLLREASPWVWRMAHLGSLTYLTLFVVWFVAMLGGQKSPNVASFTVLAVFCFPISIAHLRGKRLDDIWIINDEKLEHRTRIGNASFYSVDDGWVPKPLRRYKRHASLWVIELRKPAGKRPRKMEMLIDDLQDDPKVVEARVIRTLAPRPS